MKFEELMNEGNYGGRVYDALSNIKIKFKFFVVSEFIDSGNYKKLKLKYKNVEMVGGGNYYSINEILSFNLNVFKQNIERMEKDLIKIGFSISSIEIIDYSN